MPKRPQTTLATCVLPLLLLLAVQGGSCGGGGRSATENRNQGGPARASSPTPNANSGGVAANVNSGATGTNANAAGAIREKDRGGEGGGATMKDGQKRHLPDGAWGGTGVTFQAKDGGATVEFDCAHGSLEEFSLDADGRFSARGTFTRERGGPIRLGEERPALRATYSGEVSGETMTLRVSVESDTEFDFTLRRDSHGRLRKCL